MAKLNLNKNSKDDKPKGTRHVEIQRGNFEDYQKSKAKQLPLILKTVEEMFEDYDGGGLCIVMNTYDENGDVDGGKMFIMGIDKPEGLIKLAKSIHTASEEVIENIQQTGDPETLVDAIHAMLKMMSQGKE